MKNMMLIIGILLTLVVGCNEEEQTKKLDTTSIYGAWQWVEVYSGPPSGEGWMNVKNGYTYDISSNESFKSSKYDDCNTGIVSINSDSISFEYDCEGFTTGIESPMGVFTYQFLLEENGFLRLNPIYKNCVEGCYIRFKKIADEPIEGD